MDAQKSDWGKILPGGAVRRPEQSRGALCHDGEAEPEVRHTTLHFAGMLPARESAPTRIAFTQIPVQYGVDYM